MRWMVFVAFAALGTPGAAQESLIGPPAEASDTAPDPGLAVAVGALDEMAAKLRTLDTFEVKADVVTEEVFTDGEKLQFLNKVRYVVDRPGKMYVSIRSDRIYRRIYYDGANLTVTAPTTAYYATAPMSGTIRDLLDRAYDRYGIELPLDNLFTWGQPGADDPKPTEAFLVGFSQIGDHPTDQYFYRAEGVDWQIWIGRDDGLPHRLVISNTEDVAQPLYMADLEWNLTPDVDAGQFTFTPTDDYKLVPLLQQRVASAQ